MLDAALAELSRRGLRARGGRPVRADLRGARARPSARCAATGSPRCSSRRCSRCATSRPSTGPPASWSTSSARASPTRSAPSSGTRASCPHGKPIPQGPCCRELSQTIEPLVQPLDRLPAGSEGRIVYIVPRERGPPGAPDEPGDRARAPTCASSRRSRPSCSRSARRPSPSTRRSRARSTSRRSERGAGNDAFDLRRGRGVA